MTSSMVRVLAVMIMASPLRLIAGAGILPEPHYRERLPVNLRFAPDRPLTVFVSHNRLSAARGVLASGAEGMLSVRALCPRTSCCGIIPCPASLPWI
jgi:hypothetical protein